MTNHEAFKEAKAAKESSPLTSMGNDFQELTLDLQELAEKADNPVFVATLLYKLAEERRETNRLLASIDRKYDAIMLEVKSKGKTEITQIVGQEPGVTNEPNKYTTLSEQDESILKFVEDKGSTTAKDIKVMLNYKGANAACQRLNKLYREGLLKKVQQGKKVLYLAKS